MPHSWKRQGRTVFGKSLVLLAVAGLVSTMTPKTATACPLALIVAMDGSSSVDAREHALQLQGLALALQDPEVVDAISAVGGIWFSSFEWSGRYQQVIQVDWSFLDGAESAKAAADKLARSRRGFNEFPTALGYALGYAAVHLNKAPEKCARQVIDVAGDGIRVDAGILARLPEVLRQSQALFDRTGGVHAAGLFTAEGELLCLREDVGRHNAVDKIVGWAVREDRLPLSGTVLQVSGRAWLQKPQLSQESNSALALAATKAEETPPKLAPNGAASW